MIEPTPRIIFPPQVRRYVYERDDFTCVACGKTHQEAQLTIDHIIPVSKGGSHDLSNLQTLCFTCNRLKSNHADPRFRRRYSD